MPSFMTPVIVLFFFLNGTWESYYGELRESMAIEDMRENQGLVAQPT